MENNNDNGNGRITTALLAQQQSHILELLSQLNTKFDKQDAKWDEQNRTLTEIKVKLANQESRICTNEGDIEALEKKSDNWNAINSILVFIAGILGFLGLK